MQDRFKLRVWDEVFKKIYEVTRIDLIRNAIYYNDGDYVYYKLISEANLMRSTGIFDKNGKLIFDGHIVRVCGTEELGVTEIDIEENCIVKWDKKSAFYFCDVINKRGIKLTEHGYYDFDYLPLFQNESDEEMFDFEIIGNIYENPELLG